MQPACPIDTRSLFVPLHTYLISLLRSLSASDWQRPTVCAGWTVKDVTSHLLDGCLRRITLYRDGYSSPDGAVIDAYQTLVRYLNQLNQDWVVATRRLSPAVLTSELYYPLLDTLMRALPYTYRQVTAPTGTFVQVRVAGVDGGNWYLYRQPADWQVVIPSEKPDAKTIITIDSTIAWRLFTKGISTENALPYITIDGDPVLGKPVLSMLSVMA